jgi:hypothetical protein
VQNPLIFETGISRAQIDDFLPQLDQIGELECPTENLNGEPQAALSTDDLTWGRLTKCSLLHLL